MITNLRFDVYARTFDNPILAGDQQDLTINIMASSGGCILLERSLVSVSYQTHYVLGIRDLEALGTGRLYDEREATLLMRDLVLSINLFLRRTALSARPLHPDSQAACDFMPLPTKTEITQDEGGVKRIRVDDSIRLVDRVAWLLKAEQEFLEEADVLCVLGQLIALDRHNLGSSRTTHVHNLAAALNAFEEAMNIADLVPAFRSLYVAFEKAVNWGQDREGQEFDCHAASLCCCSQQLVKSLRNAYARHKHVDRDSNDIKRRMAAEAELPQSLFDLRQVCSAALRKRLEDTSDFV